MLPERPSPPIPENPGAASAATPVSSATEFLDRLTGIAAAARDRDALVRASLALLLPATGAEAGLVLVPGPGRASIPLGWTGPTSLAAWSPALAREAEESGLPVLVADLRSERRAGDPDALLARGYRAYLCQPLLAGGGTVGSLHLLASVPERFTVEAVATAALGARVLALAVAVQCSRLEMQSRSEESAREVTLLLELSRALGRLTRRREIADIVLAALPEVGDLDLGQVLLAERGGWDLVVREVVPLSAEIRGAARESSLAAFRARGGATAGEVRVREQRATQAAPMDGAALRSEVHQVLERRGRPVGLVSLFACTPDAFAEPVRRVLTTLAHQVSVTLDRLETAREREHSRLESVVDAMEEGLLWLDARGHLRVANPAGRRILREIGGEAVPPVLRRLGAIDLEALRQDLLAGRRPRFQEEIRSDATGRVYSVTASPVVDRGARAEGMVLLLADVTEATAFRDKLAQTEKLSALGEMISGVAHELNNPLAAVMGYAQLLDAAQDLAPAVRKKVRSINEQANRCQRIVHSLLSFARHHHPQKAAVDLNGVVRAVMQLMEYPLRVEGATVCLDLDPEIPAVLADSHQLQQVLLNLVTNAHHAMQESGRPGRLTVRSAASGPRVVISVEDNGIGIPPQHLRRVFDPFFTTKTIGKGTGLGLSLAYGCVTEHGGEIRVESAAGEWTRFVIELPACAQASPQPPAEAAPRSPARTRAGRSILVVDDEPEIAAVLAEALASEGHSVELAADGLQAREAIARRAFDLVISDLKMPQMDGRALFEALQRLPEGRAPRVVFATGDTVSAETIEFLRRSGARYLTKPFTLARLLDVVDEALRPSD